MIFEYLPEEVFTKQLDIVDIGNVSLRSLTGSAEEYYLLIKTIMGKSTIVKFGPTMPDSNLLLPFFSLSCKKVDYKESILQKEINLFIQDTKKNIIDVQEITEVEVLAALPDIVDSIQNLED